MRVSGEQEGGESGQSGGEKQLQESQGGHGTLLPPTKLHLTSKQMTSSNHVIK